MDESKLRVEWDEALGLYRCWIVDGLDEEFLGVLIPDHRRDRNTMGADVAIGDKAVFE